jgi:hypothetical protein
MDELPPDEAEVRKDLQSHWFNKGVALGRWRLVGLFFPELYIAVSAAPRPESPTAFLHKMNVEGFRAIGPTGQLWHGSADRPLSAAERPLGEGAAPYFSEFGPCLYHPIDRLSFVGGHWANEYHDERWRADSHLTRYLEVLHAILNDPQYAGARVPEGAVALPPRLVARPAA